MTRASGDESSVPAERYIRAFNEYGLSFQHTVQQVAEEQRRIDKSKWEVVSDEYPVAAKGRNTRIDILLKLRGTPLFMAVECKRTNPAYSEWCFAQAPGTHGRRTRGVLLLEVAQVEGNTVYASGAGLPLPEHHYYQRALVVKIPKESRPAGKGDSAPAGPDRESIEKAAGQVCTGVSGLAECFAQNPYLHHGEWVAFLPVVVTTARLIAIDEDLSDADLKTGEIAPEDRRATERPWVMYQYHMSPGVTHSSEPLHWGRGLREYRDLAYVRTIAVVSAIAWQHFLREFDADQLDGLQRVGGEPAGFQWWDSERLMT